MNANTVQLLTVNSSQGGPINKSCQIGQLLRKQNKTKRLLKSKKIQLHQLFARRNLYKDKRIQILNHAICRFTQHCTQLQQPFMVISGDHSSAMGTWSGVLNSLQPTSRFGLLWLDAHLDAHTFDSSPSGNCHGMPIAALLGKADLRLKHLYPSKRYLNADNLIMLGTRSYESVELSLLNQLSVTIIHAHQINNFTQAFQSAYQKLCLICTHIGISLDLDLVDPSDAPAVSTPVADGIKAVEILEAFTSIQGDSHWCGLECAEFIPAADHKNRTLNLLLEIMQIYTSGYERSSKPNKFLGLESSGTIGHSIPS